MIVAAGMSAPRGLPAAGLVEVITSKTATESDLIQVNKIEQGCG